MGNENTKNIKKLSILWLILMILIIAAFSIGYTVYADIYLTNKPESAFDDVNLDAQLMNTETATPHLNEQAVNTPYPELTPTSIPTATPVPEIPQHINQYLNENNDTVGYIRIDDTLIDYPVVYSGDNDFYLKNDFNKRPSYLGAVFLDFRCDVYDMQSTRNVILYGHNNQDGTMFNGLVHYFGEDFFNEHRIITFDTLAGEMQWEVFAVFETHIDFYYINTVFETDRDWISFINYCQSISVHQTDTVLQKDDIVLTLSTCAVNKDYRNVVMARLIK